MENNHGGFLTYCAIILIGIATGLNINELRVKNTELNSRIKELEQKVTDFTNQYAQAHSPTNLTSQTEYTSTPTLSRRTPGAIRYAEKLNQNQARGTR